MAFWSRRLRGSISTRVGVFITGMKTKISVDPGLQDIVTPIVDAQINALSTRNTSSIYITHDNRLPMQALPNSIENLVTMPRRRALPYSGVGLGY